MKKIVSIIVFVGIYANTCFSFDGTPVNGREIQQKVHDRYTGDDITGHTTMQLVSKTGQVRLRRFDRYVKDYNKKKKILIRVHWPPDIERTGFLVWENPEGADTQFLYLPAMKKTRRIATQDQDQSFLGSDFTLYDMGNIIVDDYTYSDVSTKLLDQRECYYYVCTAAPEKNPIYSKIETWTDKEYYIRTKMVYYDRKGNPLKTFYAKETKLTQDIWTPYYLFIENLQDGHKTEYRMSDIIYNSGHTDEMFTLTTLETCGEADGS